MLSTKMLTNVAKLKEPMQTNNSSSDFFYERVNSSKVNLCGNKATQKPEQPGGLLFIIE